MSFKRKVISAVTSAFAVVALTTFVSAQDTDKSQTDNVQKQEKRGGYGKRGGHGKGMRGMRGLRQLNLTDAQKEQIRTIMEANRTANQGTFEELRQIRETRRNGGTLTDVQKERLQVLRQQMKQNSEAVHQQILGILTAEQRTQLEQQKEQMKQRWEERKKMRQERKQKQTTDTQETY